MKKGFLVVAVCTSGAQAISSLEGLNGGIIISGYRFEDMLFKDLYQNLPENFEMLLVASQNRVGDDLDYKHLVYLPMPLKVHDLIATLSMMCEAQIRLKKKRKQKPQPRSEEDRLLITKAKELLMDRNHMTEAGGPSLSAEMQYGQRYRYDGNCTDGDQPDSDLKFRSI